MRVPAQTAPATRTTTDPWSSGSTVGIFQVRDSDGFDLKGMGLCLSLCMHNMHNMLRACLLTAQSLYSRLREHIHQRIPYVCLSRACLVWTNQSVPSLSCLDKPISVFLTSVRPEPPACALAFVLAAIAMLLRSRFCAPLPPFLLAIALSVSTCSFFLLFLLLHLLCLVCLRFSHQCDAAKASYL
jgi:hypothetical protein